MENNTYQSLCTYCFEPLAADGSCPACHGDQNAPVPDSHLRPGTMLRNRFFLGRALGQDASGIVYSALDQKNGAKLRIREYLPRDSAQRMPDGTVQIIPGATESFQAGIEKMQQSAHSDDPSKRRMFFEENGTGYLAQKRVQPIRSEEENGEEPVEGKKLTRQMLIIGGAVVALVIAVMIIVISISRSALDRTSGTTPPGEDGAWIAPEVTATPTPMPSMEPSPTPTDLLSWQNEEGGDNLSNGRDRTPTPAPQPTPVDNWDDWDEDDGWYDANNPAATRRPTTAPTPVANYRKASAEQISELQWRLIELRWLNASSPTGKYDNATENAVRAFQQHINDNYAKMSVDGTAGPKTVQWLNDPNAPIKPNTTPVPQVTPTPTPSPRPIETGGPVELPEYDAEIVASIQGYLVDLGYLTGTPNGVYNTATQEAVLRFQRNYGLTETIYLNQQTWDALVRASQAQTPTPTPWIPEPVTPAPVTPEPWIPEPVTPEPVTPEPVTPEPVTPEPVTPEPVTPEPVAPEPVTPEPVTPEPVTPEPVTPEPVTPEPLPEYSPQVVQQAQQYLNQLGYLTQDEISHQFDERTMSAVMAFQRDNGLQPTGLLDADTQNLLYETANPPMIDPPLGGDEIPDSQENPYEEEEWE